MPGGAIKARCFSRNPMFYHSAETSNFRLSPEPSLVSILEKYIFSTLDKVNLDLGVNADKNASTYLL